MLTLSIGKGCWHDARPMDASPVVVVASLKARRCGVCMESGLGHLATTKTLVCIRTDGKARRCILKGSYGLLISGELKEN